ncbi:hypothetical protein ACJJIG_16460 [Microbulbifer sp. SSSA007]|uniref:hypothetical protein n=1 Tax=Microbulbifer sp. SSSA007 TaxID=3243379 RepID=UPI00403A6E80
MYKKLLSTLLLTGALSVQAAVPSAVGKIQGISAYDSFGGGDVLIKTAGSCESIVDYQKPLYMSTYK